MTPGELIDHACVAFDIDVWNHGVQIIVARDLSLAHLPQPAALGSQAEGSESQAVAPWVEQQELGVYTPPFVPYPLLPTRPALLWQFNQVDSIAEVMAGLLLRYPATHTISLLLEDESVRVVALDQLGMLGDAANPACLYVPPLSVQEDLRGADGPTWVAARLLGPAGCPWDVEQTHQSLRAGLLEEVYEVLEALDAGDMVGLVEELGDLLLQTLVHAEMARQAGHFDLGDVYAQLGRKLINRHPHVFGALAVEDTGAVLRNWEAIKAQELAAKGRERAGTLDGVPPGLPALATTQKLVKKAARVGFDWPDMSGAWGKLREELAELEAEVSARNTTHTAEELGDVLFSLVTLAHWLHIDAETALREANAKFRRRFAAVEEGAQAHGRAVSDLSLPEMQAFWATAKEHETQADADNEVIDQGNR